MKLRALAVWAVASGTVAALAEPETFSLPSFTVVQLQALDAYSTWRLTRAIEDFGAFTVTEWDAQGSASQAPFAGTLEALVKCLNGGETPGAPVPEAALNMVIMEDGISRRTLATSAVEGDLLPLPEEVSAACPLFVSSANRLRQAVDSVGRIYGQRLDDIVYGARPPSTTSFAAAAARAESLEHFHMFTQEGDVKTSAAAGASEASGNAAMLSLHTDIGLFLVTTTASYIDLATGDTMQGAAAPASGLILQLADGTFVKPLLPQGSLLVMNGEAATQWMKAGTVAPRAPPHEVQSLQLGGAARAWFGRMYFPDAAATLAGDAAADIISEAYAPAAAVQASRGLSFGEYRSQTYAAFHGGAGHAASSAGCAPISSGPDGARRVLVDPGSCTAAEKYCWMGCRAIPADLVCASADMVCRNPIDGTFWPENYTTPTGPTHCFDCIIQCPNGDGTYGTGATPTPTPTPPTSKPTRKPTRTPTSKPTRKPTRTPTSKPTRKPTRQPTRQPTRKPTRQPTRKPTRKPTAGV